MQESLKRVCVTEHAVRIDLLKNEVSPSCVLHEWLSPLGFNASQIQDILHSLDAESGRMFYAKEWQLLKDREALLLRKINEEKAVPQLLETRLPKGPDYSVKKDCRIACLDAAKIVHPLLLRKWKSGDVFMPYGMKGSKKVRDYLRDRKLSLFEKDEQLVVTCGEKIVWLVNERVDQRFCVTSETKEVLEITLKA